MFGLKRIGTAPVHVPEDAPRAQSVECHGAPWQRVSSKRSSPLLAFVLGTGVIAGLIGGALTGSAGMARADGADGPIRQITVTGEGVVMAVPDMAVISMGVRHSDANPAEAMTKVSAAAQAMVDRLKSLGIAAKDLQTSNLSLRQLESYGSGNKRRIDGYEAANTLTVRIRDLDGLGQVLTAVLQDGANQFGGLNFALSDPAEATDAARQAAVKDAMAKAALYAAAAGVELGDVLSISEVSTGFNPRPMMRMEMAAMADAPVEAGELSLSQQVMLVIALQ